MGEVKDRHLTILDATNGEVRHRLGLEGHATSLAFEKDGKQHSFAVSGGGRFFVDEIFFIEDPRELYSHWTDEDWVKIEAHRVEAGMSEFQIVFALGFGEIIEQRAGGKYRVVEYRGGVEHGVAPVRVRYTEGVSTAVEPIEEPE